MAGVVGQIQGERVTEQGGQIIEAKRRVITHVAPGPSGLAAIQNALNDPSVPADGDAYSFANPEVQVVRREGSVLSVDKDGLSIVQIEVFYKWMPSDGWISSAGASLEAVRTHLDADGNDIELTLGGVSQTVEALALRPTTNMTIEIYNVASPRFFVSRFVGHTNSKFWAGGEAGTWWCSGATYDKMTKLNSDISGIRRYQFTFQYREAGWAYEANFWSSEIAMIPAGLTGDATKNIKIYPEVAFQDLKAVL